MPGDKKIIKYKPEILKVATVAADLGVCNRTVRRFCEAGELPAFKIAGTWMILAEAYRQFIEAKKNGAIEIFLTTLEANRTNRVSRF